MYRTRRAIVIASSNPRAGARDSLQSQSGVEMRMAEFATYHRWICRDVKQAIHSP
jgi:hypothetical protein